MPQIKIERIVSFTSEDPIHTASNILSKDTSKKWKCKTPGEKTVSVVLQLDQACVINSIDIGNENSAYIEVLVSRSSSPEDFKVLLVMSSFMTPLEARQSQNVNKVRMFKHGDLSDPEKKEKWDRVKIVCTQPFNRHVQYGLSFINLYSSDCKIAEKPQQNLIGNFIIRPASPDNISTGSLFARRKQLQEDSGGPALKGAAAIREATSLAHIGSPAPKQKVKIKLPGTPNAPSRNKNIEDDTTSTPIERKERNRNELLYSKDDEDKHDKIDKLIAKRDDEKAEASRIREKVKQTKKDTPSKTSEKKKDHRDETQSQTPKKATGTPNEPKTKRNDNHRDSELKESLKRKQSKDSTHKLKKLKKEVVGKPFERLLEDVVLVISGIQNPDRASLRSMALSMGAKYQSDWNNTCSHLICAFANTPKFNQVKGKGKIVKRGWIEDCYNERKKLPWRRYALDKADKGPESEGEICEKDDTPSPEPMESYCINSDSDDETREQGSDTDEKIAELRKKGGELIPVDIPKVNTKNESDTEEEIAETKNEQKQLKPVDIFSIDTDSESPDENIHPNFEIKHKLKNFFEDKIFYVDENFDDEMEMKVKQYIAAYNGILVENLEAAIDIIVTKKGDYKVLKDLYPSATFIAPDWVWECHNRQRLVSMKDFIYE